MPSTMVTPPENQTGYVTPTNGIRVEIDVAYAENGKIVRVPRPEEIAHRMFEIEENIASAQVMLASSEPMIQAQGKAMLQAQENFKRFVQITQESRDAIQGEVNTRIYYLTRPSLRLRLQAEDAATTWNTDGTYRFSDTVFMRELLPHCIANFTPEQVLDGDTIYPFELTYLWEQLKTNLSGNEAQLPFFSRSARPH